MKFKIIAIVGSLGAVALLFTLGRTKEDRKIAPAAAEIPELFDINTYILRELKSLSPSVKTSADSCLSNLNSSAPSEKILIFNRLSELWMGREGNPIIYSYYVSEAAKLVNSEKNLNFAAQLTLDVLRSEKNDSKIEWLSSRAIDLFNRAIKINPSNDDFKVGLGSVYIFGKGRTGHPEENMKGIMQILEVVRRDSNNMKAQLMLGIGGLVSGQYEKAVQRLLKVVQNQPDNLEAVSFLADAYAATNNKEEAVKWYTVSKRLANNTAYSKEVDERIAQLR